MTRKEENFELLEQWANLPRDEGLDLLFNELVDPNESLLPTNEGELMSPYQKAVYTIIQYQDYCENIGLKLLAYEGGQHLRSDKASEAVHNFLADANKDDYMGAIYLQYFDTWKQITNNAPFFNFASGGSKYNKFGSWGLFENLDDNYAKYHASCIS